MKIRPVILCGGTGTRLWPQSKNNNPKQFIDFGGWSLFEKTLDRVKASIYDYPIISTNFKYLKKVKSYLKKFKFKKYKIIVEPAKKNTAPAILSSTLIKDIPNEQCLMFLPADHLVEKLSLFNKAINKNKKNLTDQNIFIFGIKPNEPSIEYGYFLSKKIERNINKVTKFIEKPNKAKAKQVIEIKGYWNAGMFFARKDSIINNFKKYLITPEQEFVEAHSFLAVIDNKEIPSLKSLKVSEESYILGLLDCIGELKRFVLDNIRNDQLKKAEIIFNVMENLYQALYPFAMYDKIVKETRRKLDVNRILVEETRAVITEEIRRNHFVKALTKK